MYQIRNIWPQFKLVREPDIEKMKQGRNGIQEKFRGKTNQH